MDMFALSLSGVYMRVTRLGDQDITRNCNHKPNKLYLIPYRDIL